VTAVARRRVPRVGRIAVTADPQNRLAATIAALGGALAAVGTFLDWFTIEIGGVTAPGGSATGWEGRDGRTVLAGAVVSFVAAALVVLGSKRLAPKIALIVAGGVTAVIAIAGIVDTTGKADSVADEFAIPADRINAAVGSGLWLVTAAGLAEVLAGVIVRPPKPGQVRSPVA
jgi:hypothetical protein